MKRGPRVLGLNYDEGVEVLEYLRLAGTPTDEKG